MSVIETSGGKPAGADSGDRRPGKIDPRGPRPPQPSHPFDGLRSVSDATRKALGFTETAGSRTAVIDTPTEKGDRVRLPTREYDAADLSDILIELTEEDTRRGRRHPGRMRQPLTPRKVIKGIAAAAIGVGLAAAAARSFGAFSPDTIPTDALMGYDGTPVDAYVPGYFQGYETTVTNFYNTFAPNIDFGSSPDGFKDAIFSLHQAVNDTAQGKETAGLDQFGFGYVDPNYLTMLRTAYENPDQYPQIAGMLSPFSNPDSFPPDQLATAQQDAGQQLLSLLMGVSEHRDDAVMGAADGIVYLDLPGEDGQTHRWAIPPLPNRA